LNTSLLVVLVLALCYRNIKDHEKRKLLSFLSSFFPPFVSTARDIFGAYQGYSLNINHLSYASRLIAMVALREKVHQSKNNKRKGDISKECQLTPEDRRLP
jgi:hypothetical protein